MFINILDKAQEIGMWITSIGFVFTVIASLIKFILSK